MAVILCSTQFSLLLLLLLILLTCASSCFFSFIHFVGGGITETVNGLRSGFAIE